MVRFAAFVPENMNEPESERMNAQYIDTMANAPFTSLDAMFAMWHNFYVMRIRYDMESNSSFFSSDLPKDSFVAMFDGRLIGTIRVEELARNNDIQHCEVGLIRGNDRTVFYETNMTGWTVLSTSQSVACTSDEANVVLAFSKHYTHLMLHMKYTRLVL